MGHRSAGDSKIITYCVALVLFACAILIVCVALRVVSPSTNTCEQSGSIAGPSGSSASLKITYNCDNSHDEDHRNGGLPTPSTATISPTTTTRGGDTSPPPRPTASSNSKKKRGTIPVAPPVVTTRESPYAPPSSIEKCGPTPGPGATEAPPRSSQAPTRETTPAQPADVTTPSTSAPITSSNP